MSMNEQQTPITLFDQARVVQKTGQLLDLIDKLEKHLGISSNGS